MAVEWEHYQGDIVSARLDALLPSCNVDGTLTAWSRIT